MNNTSQFILQILQKQYFFVQEAPPIAYGDDFVQVPDEKDLLRAHLMVELIERYGYSPRSIGVGVYVLLRHKGVRYEELDIVVHDQRHNPCIIAAVELPEHYEANQTQAMQKLFAASASMRQKPKYLLYYTRWYEKQDGQVIRKTRYLVVDFSQYQSYSSWYKFGSPTLPDIPQNPS